MAYSSYRDPSLLAQLCDFILIEEDLFPPRAQNIEVGKQSAGRVKARLEGKVHFFSNFLFVQLLIIHLSRLREHKTAKVMFCQNLTPPVWRKTAASHACMHALPAALFATSESQFRTAKTSLSRYRRQSRQVCNVFVEMSPLRRSRLGTGIGDMTSHVMGPRPPQVQ